MSNLQRLQATLKEKEMPALLVNNLASVQWLTGFTGSFGTTLVTQNEGLFITDSRYTLQAQEQVKEMPSCSFGSPRTLNDFLAEQMQGLGITELAIDENTVTVGQWRVWKEQFAGVSLLPTLDPILELRVLKTPDEIRRIRTACQLIDACMEHLVTVLHPGMTELQGQWEIENFLRKNDSTPAFPSIVVSGERSARPHGVPSNKPMEQGDFVTVDIGARVEGYCSDITRTFVIGKPTPRHTEVYEQVLKAEQAGVAALQVGANGREIDKMVRGVLDEKGLAQYFGHGLGHGLGALVHDTGRLSSNEDRPICAGQVWTVEPGVYIEGFGGVRIEDDVLVTETGNEVLTHFSRELISV